MNIWAWLVVGYLALETRVTIGQVGKPLAATPGVAVFAAVILGLLAVCVTVAAVAS